MELELGVKLTRVLDDFSSAEFLLAKDRGGPLFLSSETDAMFVLSAHLKGYTRRHVKIDINEDGTRIVIRGEQRVQETVMVGWKVYKKDTEIRGFRKAFKIPDGVILDKIKARFNEDGTILTILMPKLVKGVRGMSLEEVEEEEVAKEGPGSFQIAADEASDKEQTEQEDYEEPEINDTKEDQRVGSEIENEKEVENLPSGKASFPDETLGKEIYDLEGQTKAEETTDESIRSIPQETYPASLPSSDEDKIVEEHKHGSEAPRQELEDEKIMQQRARVPEVPGGDLNRALDKTLPQEEAADQGEYRQDQAVDGKEVDGRENEVQKEEQGGSELSGVETERLHDQSTQRGQPSSKKPKLCVPILAGSALLVSLIVFVFRCIRTRNQPGRRRQ